MPSKSVSESRNEAQRYIHMGRQTTALPLLLLWCSAGCQLFLDLDPPEEQGPQCSDGIDNDGNDRTDCEEPACAAEPACANLPPSAADDDARATEDTPLVLPEGNLIANDTDP